MISETMEEDSDKIEPSDILDEFSELITTYFQPLDPRMEYAKELKESITYNIADYCYDPEFAIRLTEGSKQALERKLIELLLEFFTVRAQDLELVIKTGVNLKALKVGIGRIKKHAYALHHQLDVFERKLEKASILFGNESLNRIEFVHTDEDGSNGLPMKLSKKLVIIRSQLIRECVWTSSLEDSSKKSSGFSETADESEEGREDGFKREYQEEEEDYVGVKTVEELKIKIGEVTAKKRAEIKIAREDGRKSFMEWLKECDEPSEAEYWKSVHKIKDVAYEFGILLSLVLSDFLFVASDSENKVKKFQKYFKAIVGYFLFPKEKNWMAIQKIVSVCDLAEMELVKMGLLRPEVLDDQENVHDEAEIFDEYLDYFLGIVLWLEFAVWSYPISRPESGNINLNEELMDLEEALLEGKGKLKDARSMVQSLRTMQYDQWTAENDDVLMAEFQEVMKLKVAEIWGENGQIDEAN